MSEDGLNLDAETMRALGYRTVDLLVERIGDASIPPLRRATPADMQERLSGPPPADGEDFEAILEQLERDVLPFMGRADHPGFFAFIPGAGTWPGALGDFVASALNVYTGSWMESAGPSQVELEVLGWFKDWVGYATDADGSLVTGGSAANLAALACAREQLVGPMSDDLVVYVGDQGHSSLARGARLLGFRPDQVRVLPVDDAYRLRPETVASAMAADKRAGRKPLLVAACGGATNTGAVDPLGELADLCRANGVWLHVDAAYGGFVVLTDRGRAALAGIDRADSIALDPHKWLYQPFECGCLLVRRAGSLRAAFEITPAYLAETTAGDAEVNFGDLGTQLTRSWRALKLWLSLRYFGVDAFRAAIDRALDLAELARRRIEASEAFELAAPPSLGIVCFRRRFDGDEDAANAGLVAALERSGLGLVSSTRLRGRYAIRLCVLSHRSGPGHVEQVLDFLERAEPVASAREHERHPDIRRSWLRQPPAGVAVDGGSEALVPRVPLFAALSSDDALTVAGLASSREVSAGEAVVRQWDVSRDFFVIVEGTVDVVLEDEPITSLGPGDFFGELGALEWGAGFGYPRLASVVATSPVSLLVFPDGSLNQLVRAVPSVREVVESAVRERLYGD